MIQNFELIQKNHNIFGAGEENNVGSLVKNYPDSCLVVHDGGVYLDELLKRVRKSLSDKGIKTFKLPGC
jgi:alcohol dehydrogenase YqhD (iron-dependent ADH family)